MYNELAYNPLLCIAVISYISIHHIFILQIFRCRSLSNLLATQQQADDVSLISYRIKSLISGATSPELSSYIINQWDDFT